MRHCSIGYVNYQGSKSLYSTLILVVMVSSPVSIAAITEAVFTVARGLKLSLGTQLRTVHSESIGAILCSALCSSGCGSATYSVKHKTCITFMEKFYHSSIVWSQNPDWVVLYRKEQRVQHGDWTMVFRAQNEVNIPLYDTWTNTGQNDYTQLSSGVLNGCCRLDNLGGCKNHFKSTILDNWSNIREVKFSVYVNGSEVNYIVFNGTSTTRDSWFNQSNILRSSWLAIKIDLTINYFDTVGYTTYPVIRRFIISGAYFSCTTYEAYFLAVDKAGDVCSADWSMNITNFPVFVYSLKLSMARLGSSPREYMVADVMAVFVKF